MNAKVFLRPVIQTGVWALILAVAAPGCQRQADEPESLFSKSFASLEADAPVSVVFEPAVAPPYLVAVSGHETEFRSQVYGPAESPLSSVNTPLLRLVPHYHVVEENDVSGAIAVEVLPIRVTRNASLDIEVFHLANASRSDKKLARAYRLYSGAIQTTEDETIETWKARVGQLREAAELFDDTGMDEERLWAGSLASYFSYYPVFDNRTAISESRRLYSEATALGYPRIALMNLHTQGQALIEPEEGNSVDQNRANQLEAQEWFNRAANLAAELQLDFEQCWANNNRGIGYYYLGEHDESLGYYGRALEIAMDLDDGFMVGMVQGNQALLMEKKGDYLGCLRSLEELNRYYREKGTEKRLIHNLTELGRVHRNLYQFHEAVEVLSEAIRLAKGLDSQGRNELRLAMAYFSMGYLERAANIVDDAIVKMVASDHVRGVSTGYRLAADIARNQGDFERMRSLRKKQGEYLVSDVGRANYSYYRGLDELATGADHSRDAAFEFFQEAYRQNTELDNPVSRRRSQLRMCSVAPAGSQSETCSYEALQAEYEALASSALPQEKIEAMQVWSDILHDRRDTRGALKVMADMIAQIQFYRATLPGVLGAWYWESRAKIFDDYLELTIDADVKDGDGAASLLAIDRLRNIELSYERPATGADVAGEQEQPTDQLRNLLAYRNALKDREAIQQVEMEIDRLLLAQQTAAGSGKRLDEAWLARASAGLPDDSMVLTYHFSPSGSWAWLLDRGGARLRRISGSDDVAALIDKTRGNFRVVGYLELEEDLAALGRILVGSLPVELPTNVYLLPSGPLNGFPFDALRLNGRYLAEDHVLVNLMSLGGIESLPASLDAPVEFQNIFLAGNPLLADSELPALRAAGDELDMVQSAFPVARVEKLEDAELSVDAFHSDVFLDADLVHIASHASIDMGYPELSRLALSAGDARDFLSPYDLADTRLSAKLVVLSACETVGGNRFRFDSNLGFVSGFLKNGAGSVVASLWPVSDKGSLAWFDHFYRQLSSGTAPVLALAETKRHAINTVATGNGIDHWAAYQVFVN